MIKSPPAREVWIEILVQNISRLGGTSHLPRGRCGLKLTLTQRVLNIFWSPPAREVWIEIEK